MVDKTITKAGRLILRNRFETDIAVSKSVFICNVILGLFFCFGYGSEIFSPVRLLVCLLTGIIYFVFSFYYDWRNVSINVLIAMLYIVIVLGELIFLGFPTGLGLGISSQLTKGFLLDLVLWMVPYVYIGLRISLIIPLIKIYYTSKIVDDYL